MFHRRVSKLAVIYQRLFHPRKPTCTVCSISPPVKRRIERTTHALRFELGALAA